MLESSVGSLTIVNANNNEVSLFWQGEKLKNIVSSLVINTTLQRRVSLRVLNPSAVVPALSEEEVLRLENIYEVMRSSGITITKTNQGV